MEEVILRDSVQTALPIYQGVDVEISPVQLVDDELKQELLRIPDRMLFKIGEVAELVGIKPYVLRYWESEFSLLRPKKAPNNQRMYTSKDLETVFLIKKLLYRDRYSIQGARKALSNAKLELKNLNKWSKIIKDRNTASDKLTELIKGIQLAKSKLKNFNKDC